MKTTLTVEIEYDPASTDPEGLACAMDRLLETALSTPDILDDYNNPTVGEFFVAKEMTAPTAKKAAGLERTVSKAKHYALHIDGPLFRAQRQLLTKITDLAQRRQPYAPAPCDEGLLEGLVELTDSIADQAHDQHGVDCLLDNGDDAR